MSKFKKDVDEYGHKHGEKDYQHEGEPTGEHLKGDAEYSPEMDGSAPSGHYLSHKEDIRAYVPEMEESHLEKMKQYAHGGVVTGDRDENEALAKDVLHKMVSDMETHEAARIHPRHPEHAGVKNPTEDKGENFDEAEPENSENQHDGLDPKVLNDLLNKAGSAHPDGSTEEDLHEELPEEIRSAVDKKKRKVGPSLKETR
ncbi:MAG TPA: hypothetical protein VNX68_01545 [Nitrosopumilaceae archaeon]|jgi:hypothetical protein|nr:hypothetical protein [Nitrosopumilaceae archaeon]